MSYETVRKEIEQRFNTNWIDTPVQWPNVAFDPKNVEHTKEFEPGGNWVRVAVNLGVSNQVSIEVTPLKRVTGIIAIQIFTKLNSGSKLSDALLEKVRTIFEGQAFGGVICRETSKVIVGSNNGWYQVNANTVFDYDYT